MNHLEAFFLVGRDMIWIGLYFLPPVLLCRDKTGEGFLGFFLYFVVTWLCFIAGAGII